MELLKAKNGKVLAVQSDISMNTASRDGQEKKSLTRERPNFPIATTESQ